VVTKARDPDIVATSSVLSLKCPLSYSRITLPCRSTACRHTQCFDATSYLQLQEQGPTWQCPICNIPAPFESLAVDEYVPGYVWQAVYSLVDSYVRNILSNTSDSVEQVTIEPNGSWSQHSKNSTSPKPNGANFGSDDDDLVEIKDSRISALKAASTPVPSIGSTRTPPASSREPSASVASHGQTSAKRPISQVIDLTLSDDDDDAAIARAPKRQFTGYSTPQSIPTAHNGQSSS
jgi:E3 SUMO-protein ligase PIAS1